MKVFKKSELTLVDGLFVTPDNEIVCLDSDIVDLANELETKYQKALYLKEQPEAQPMPTLNGFKRESVNKIELFTIETPLNDKHNKEVIALMDEIDDAQLGRQMNDMLESMFELVMFVRNDTVVSLDAGVVHRFDTPKLGNPLDWTEDTVVKAVAKIHGCTVDEDEDGEQE